MPNLERAAQNPSSPRRRGIRAWSVRAKIGSSVLGALMAGGAAFAVTTWVVGLGAGSSGQAESGAVSNITITAVASPVATNLLSPGGTGDVVAKITNPNAFPVTITASRAPEQPLRPSQPPTPGRANPKMKVIGAGDRAGW